MQKKIVVALVLSIIVAFFAILNSDLIPINLIFATINVSTALVILISAAIGAAIVYFIGAVSRYKLKKTCKELEERKMSQEREIMHLRENNEKLEVKLSEFKEIRNQ